MVQEHHFTMVLPGGSFCLRAKALGGGSPGAFPFGLGFLANGTGWTGSVDDCLCATPPGPAGRGRWSGHCLQRGRDSPCLAPITPVLACNHDAIVWRMGWVFQGLPNARTALIALHVNT